MIDERVLEILEDVLGVAPEEVTEETSAADVDRWDSLHHLRLITAIEDELGISFTMEEVESLKNVGDLNRLVRDKINVD